MDTYLLLSGEDLFDVVHGAVIHRRHVELTLLGEDVVDVELALHDALKLASGDSDLLLPQLMRARVIERHLISESLLVGSLVGERFFFLFVPHVLLPRWVKGLPMNRCRWMPLPRVLIANHARLELLVHGVVRAGASTRVFVFSTTYQGRTRSKLCLVSTKVAVPIHVELSKRARRSIGHWGHLL